MSGTTTDLLQLPAVVVGWAEGASLNDIGRAAPFDLLTGRFEIPCGDPADIIAAEWQWLLKDARQSCWPEYQALIEVAYGEPRMRALYPYTSHWALSFSATSYPFTPSFATLLASHEGEYSLKEWWNGPTLARVATATEAIAWAINRLPDHFDPANDRTRDNN
ncbi:DUF6193 family natural product biosynthesis protein [Actinoplanes sp. NPDC026670]|uniref:DUF6193 family natural product biosynthesis protein n=1 Tax=Actinoplanes sp. NPDC026670 TaxID=3154700 RepID=UPI0033F2C337